MFASELKSLVEVPGVPRELQARIFDGSDTLRASLRLATDGSGSRAQPDEATLRRHYDTELAAIKAKVVQSHGYEAYPVLFNRTVAWDEKAPLLKAQKSKDGDEGESTGGKRKGRRMAAK